MNIFVGNLSFASTEADVKKLFEGFGDVASVVIVMRKEKKTPKSRGFGFVEMPDGGQALAAMAALNGREFMGRVLNVNPARPKTEAERKEELEKKMRTKARAAHAQRHQEKRDEKKAWYAPVFPPRAGGYKGGRRTRSYMKRQGLAGMPEEAGPKRSSRDNPMRWRKRSEQAKPWQKAPGEGKPREKPKAGSRPWKKSEGKRKPWRKNAGDSKVQNKSSRYPRRKG